MAPFPKSQYFPQKKANTSLAHFHPENTNNADWFLPTTGIARHSINAFPSKPEMQEQTGEWFTTLHSALRPQVPGQGSTHLSLTQVLS